MDLAELHIFTTVVREGGVTRAAERLHRVQSNVTTRIRQLEDDLGVALFIRQGKRLHLAPAGQVLLGYADRLLALAEEARGAVQDARPRGRFHLGAMESAAAVRLPAVLAEYHRQYPEVGLELRTGNPQLLASAILAGELDAAFVAEPIAEAAFEKVFAFDEELVIVAAPDQPPIGPKGVIPRAMVAFEPGCPHRKRLEDWYLTQGETAARTIEIGSYHAMLGCVAAGMGIALIPRSVLATFPDSRQLSVHPLPARQNRAATVLIWRRGAISPKITALRRILRDGAETTVSARRAEAGIAKRDKSSAKKRKP
jgi:DNA-binding transcriptional LysR family regulator